MRVFFSVSFVSTPLRNANARVFLVGVFFVKLLSSGCVHLSSVCYVLSVHLIRTNPTSAQISYARMQHGARQKGTTCV